MIDKLGIQHGFSDLFGKAGQEFLNQLELRPVYRDALDAYLRTIGFLDQETDQATDKIKVLLKPNPRAELLKSNLSRGNDQVPRAGIGHRTWGEGRGTQKTHRLQ